MQDTRQVQNPNRASTFSGRVVVLFGTQVVGTGLGIITGILLARLLGPAAKGDYYLLVLMPATALVLLQLGLPQALQFYAARGQIAGILTKSIVLTVALTLAAVLGAAAILPLVRDEAMGSIKLEQIALAFVGFPLGLSAMFTTAIVMGRQAVRWYSGVNIAYSISGIVLLVAVFAAFGASVNTAIAVYLLSTGVQTVGFAIGARAVRTAGDGPRRVSYRELFGYGLPFYPGSLAVFLSYRVDAYLIAFLIVNASEPLGYYSMAVGLAEMVYFLPKAVSTLFFPHVASSPREDADRQVPLVARVTMLVTGGFAILLVPAAIVLIWVILPAYGPSMPPLLVLLPGCVALSSSYVLNGYLRGIGRPGVTSTISVVSLIVNVVANVILIPRFGIVGAAAASLVSYSLTSLALSVVAARMAQVRLIDFWIPRLSDVRYLVEASANILRRFSWGSRFVGDPGA
jgi:O-antigen/teichoic acid export membrane protein